MQHILVMSIKKFVGHKVQRTFTLRQYFHVLTKSYLVLTSQDMEQEQPFVAGH